MAGASRRRLLAAGLAALFVGGGIAAVLLLDGGDDGEPVAGGDVEESPGGVRRQEVRETATVGDMTFLLTDVQCGFQNVISSEERIAAEGEFCSIDLDVTNEGGASVALDLGCQTLVDAGGASYQPHEQASLLIEESRTAFGDGIGPGTTLESVALVYDVPEGTEPASIEFHVTCDDEGQTIQIEEDEGAA